MKVKTRKLDATETESDRIKVTAEDGATATFPYPYLQGLDGRDAHAWAVRQLFGGDEFGEPVWTSEHARGETFRVDHGERLRKLDEQRMNDPRVRPEDRKAARVRDDRRRASDEIARGNA